MIRQLQSLKNLSKTRIEIVNNASRHKFRSISIRTAKDIVLAPFEASVIQIKGRKELLAANYHFFPTRQLNHLIDKVHVPEGIINGDNLWLPIQNTSKDIIKIQADSRLGIASHLNEYEIAVPADNELHVDSITVMCSDNDEILNPWDEAYSLYDSQHPETPSSVLTQEEPQINTAELQPDSNQNLDHQIIDPFETPKEKATREFHVELQNYSQEEQNTLLEFIKNFTPDTDFGHPAMTIPPAELPLKGPKIVPTPPLAKRRYSHKDELVIDNFIEVSLKSGLITPIQSPTTSALHVVYKNGKPRVVSDLRAVNSLNAGDFQFTFPRPTEKIRELVGKGYKFFSQLDLSGAFTQIPLHKDSYPLLAFTAMTKKHSGTYAYRYLNFGYKASPAVFSSVLDNILYKINSPDLEGTVINYFDDICLASKTREEHTRLLKRLFARFAKYNVKLNLKKSAFWKDSCEFCSYKISESGYRMSDDRLKILKEYPDYDVRDKRKNSDLKILGFYNYHRSFVKNYSEIEKEIRKSVKEFKSGKIDAVSANAKIKEFTDLIKRKVVETSLECIPDGTETFLQTDASGHAYGYTLFTKKGVVQYGSGSFSPSVQSSHSIFEKELKAIALAIKDCFHLITGVGKLIIMCDNLAAVFSSTAAKTKRPITPRTIKYLQMIQTYTSGLDSNIIHIGTAKNVIADCLSRLSYDKDGNFDMEATKNQLNHRKGEEQVESNQRRIYAIEEEQLETYPNIISAISSFEKQTTEYLNSNAEIVATIQHARDHLPAEIIELTAEQEYQYARKLHEATHWSSSKTLHTLKSLGYRVSAQTLERVQKECNSCGQFRRLAPRAKLNPRITESTDPLALIHIDHMQLQKTFEGHSYLLTVIDDATRMLFATPTKSKATRPVVTYLLDLMLISNREIKAISLDYGFDSTFMRDWAASKNIDLRFRPTKMSRAVLVERSHRPMWSKIDSFTKSNNTSWSKEIYSVVQSLNSQVHEVTGFQPAFLFTGNKSLPGFGAQNKEDDSMTFYRRAAVALINEAKQNRSSNYKYRTLPVNQKIIIRHDHSKHGKGMDAICLSDEGENNSTITAKLTTCGRIYKVHKSDIYISSKAVGFDKIFDPSTKEKLENRLTE